MLQELTVTIAKLGVEIAVIYWVIMFCASIVAAHCKKMSFKAFWSDPKLVVALLNCKL